MGKNRVIMTMAAALIVAAALALPHTAAGSAPQQEATGANLIPPGAAPRPADLAASALTHWLDTHANTAGGVSVDSSGTAITVAWKGAVPQAFRQLAAAQPVTVRFTTARFSSAQLTAEAGRIARTYPRLVASVGPRDDDSGLVVELAASAGPGATREAAQISSFAPLTIRGTGKTLVPMSRNADTSPFWGGALIQNGTYVCSTGVSVFSGTTSGITTAWHCGLGTWVAHDNGATLGTIWSGKRSQARDTEVIQTSSGPSAYIGAWNSTSSRLVYRAERPANNTRICSNGGVTGETCGNTYVRGINMFVNVQGVGTVGPGFWLLTEEVCGGSQCGIIQGGDSGSPADSYASTGKLIMKGLQVAADQAFLTTACKGHPSYAGHQPCYGRAFAVNTVDALSTLGVSIKVG